MWEYGDSCVELKLQVFADLHLAATVCATALMNSKNKFFLNIKYKNVKNGFWEIIFNIFTQYFY